METKEKTKNEIQNWLNVLRGVSIFNISIITIYIILYFNKISKSQALYFVLVSIYVIVCAIRSIWPRLDSECICVYKNNISSPFVGRSLATVAEMALIVLLVMITNTILNLMKMYLKNSVVIDTLKILNLMIIPTIFIAQVICWYGITTKDYFWVIVEGALWAYALIIFFLVYVYIYYKTIWKNINNNKVRFIVPFLPFIILILLSHVIFMFVNYMPLMFKNNRLYKNHVPFWKGLAELSCNKVSHKYKDWENDMPWLTGYFSISVWVSIFILFWHHRLELIK
jgi:hypothetical protein